MGIVDPATFHPRMLSDAVKIQAAEFEWLPAALENCHDGEWEDTAYVGYVSRARPNEHGRTPRAKHSAHGRPLFEERRGR